MRCSLPSTRSDAPMLTTESPRALAELMTRLLFSVIWNAFGGLGAVAGVAGPAEGVRRWDLALFNTRSSIVSATASLMSFESTSPSVHVLELPEG
jgi:hypothetical protein